MTKHESLFDLLERDSSFEIAQKCKNLREEIFERKMALKKEMDSGLDSETYQIAKRVYSSLDVAESTIQELSAKMAETHA